MKRKLVVVLASYFVLFHSVAGQQPGELNVLPIFTKSWADIDALPTRLEVDGNYSFTAFEVIEERNEVAFLSSVAPEIVIFHLGSGKRLATIQLPLVASDFTYSDNTFYTLYDSSVRLYDRDGRFIEEKFLGKNIDYQHDLRVIDGRLHVLTADERTFLVSSEGLERSTDHWVFDGSNEVRAVIKGKTSFELEGRISGRGFSARIDVQERIASVVPVAFIGDKVFLRLEKLTSDAPIQIEPKLVVWSVSAMRVLQVKELPEVWFSFVKNDFEQRGEYLYQAISTPSGISVFKLSFGPETEHPNYPFDIAREFYHYNDHLPHLEEPHGEPPTDGTPKGGSGCLITREQIELNALAYRDLVWNCTPNSLRSNCTDRCVLGCRATVGNKKVTTPPYITGVGSFTGVPYKWGGWTPLATFNSLANQNRYVGNWLTYSPSPTGCPPATDAHDVLDDSQVIGVDCSGLATRAWNETTKYSTISIQSISTELPNISQIAKGDILNLAGSHTRIYLSTNPTGTFNTVEATTIGQAKVRTYAYYWSGLGNMEDDGYVPRRYNHVCTSGIEPTTLICTNAINLACGIPYNGPSSSASSSVTTYGCNSWTETGPERVHKITTTQTGTLTATISNFSGDLDVFILSSCSPLDCEGSVSSSSATYSNAPAGVYYIVVDADDGSGSAYTLLVTCSPNTPNLPDLSVSNTGVSPSSACPGAQVTLTSTVQNTGTAASGACTMRYYLSTNTTYGAGDVFLNSSIVPSIGALNSSSVITQNVTIPGGTAPGSYFILFYANGATSGIAESNENNNVAYRSIGVNNCASGLPDLVTSDGFITGFTGCAGDMITVNYEVENIGGAAAPASVVAYYLSNNPNSGGTYLSATGIGGLGVGSGTSQEVSLTVPFGTAAGDWYIRIVNDPSDLIDEGTSGESNNNTPLDITIVDCSGLADIRITYNGAPPSTGIPEQLIDVSFDYDNIGDVDAPSSTVGFYLSQDDVFDPLVDELLDERSLNSLTVGQIRTKNTFFFVPDCPNCGDYFVIIKVDDDDEVAEDNESNNFYSFQFTITGCVVCDIVVPPTGLSFQSQGGSGNVQVTADHCCEWTATSNDEWINILNDFGYGDGTVSYTVAPCADGASRSGSISIAGQNHTITQDCTEFCNNSQNFVWAVQAGSSTLSDAAEDLAIDASGQLYMTGYIQGAASFGGGITLTTNGTAPDVFVSKHDPSGTVQWAVHFGGADQEVGSGVACSSSGDVYVVGTAEAAVTFGGTTLNPNGTNEEIAFLIKLNSSGVLQWARKVNPDYSGRANSVHIDPQGNVVVVGGVDDYIGSDGAGVFVAKYSPSGALLFYANYGMGFYLKTGFDIASNTTGDIYVVGRYSTAMTFGSVVLNTTTALDIEAFIAKLDANGAVLWVRRVTTPGLSSDLFGTVAVDSQGNVYAAGGVFGPEADAGGLVVPLTGGSMLVVKYGSDGVLSWVRASNGYADCEDMLFGQDGNLYLSGYFASSLELGSEVITEMGGQDAFMGSMDANGTVNWLRGFGGSTHAETANGIVTNATNEVFVAGEFRGTNVFGSTTLTSLGSADVFLAKYQHCDLPEVLVSASGPLAICQGESVLLGTDYCESSSYQWILDGAEIDGATNPTYSASEPGSYAVIVTVAPGCSATSASVFVSLEESIVVVPGNYGPLCSNSAPIPLNGTPTNGTWSGQGVQGNQFDPSSGTQTLAYSVAVGDCSATAWTTIQVEEAPTLDSIDGSTTVLVNAIEQYEIPAIDGATYSWTHPNGWVSNVTDSTLLEVTIGPPLYTTVEVCVEVSLGACVQVACMDVWVDGTTVMSDVATGSPWFIVVPNPSQGDFQLLVSGANLEPTEFRVYNALGELVVAPLVVRSSQPQVLNLVDESTGVYYMRATRADEVRVVELVLQR